MEVKNVNTSAKSKVGDVSVKYSIKEKDGKKEMQGQAYRDDDFVGSMNYSQNGGALGISFHADALTWAEQKAVTEQVLADIEQLNTGKEEQP